MRELNKTCDLFDAKLTMVGVWDTVGSLGIPAMFGGVEPALYGFLDTTLHPDVLNAYHAMAIDERRAEFPATLWTSSPAPGQTLEQVWFCGVHCDVGGSYPDDSDGSALSDLTLAWMMSKASALGLEFDAGGCSRNTRFRWIRSLRSTRNTNPGIAYGHFRKADPSPPIPPFRTAYLSRCEHDSSYRPGNLTFTNGQLASGYGKALVISQAARKRRRIVICLKSDERPHLPRCVPMKAILFFCICGLGRGRRRRTPDPKLEEAKELKACAQMVLNGLRKIPDARAQRFLGKVTEAEALCRGGEKSLQFRLTPWVDWSQYWGTGDMSSLPTGYLSKKGPAFRGVTGALLDLEYQRVELIKFNLFDNNGTWRSYITGRERHRRPGAEDLA